MIALVGAAVLLYIDRIQHQRGGRVRQMWAKAQNFTYTVEDPNLPATWRRAALAKQDYLSAVDIVSGIRRGEQFFLFDLEDTATIVAVRREIGSDVDIDLRLKTTPPPRDADMELLGGIGPRIVFATNLEIARRVCDQRMVAFTEGLPAKLQMLWSEGNWTLGSLPITAMGRDWDDAIDSVARLSGMLHVLPPPREPRAGRSDRGGNHDPGRPRPPQTDLRERPARVAPPRVAPPTGERRPVEGFPPPGERGRAPSRPQDFDGPPTQAAERIRPDLD
ncbi:hypothetical protein [Antrihabitans cavernicola]|uniref:hypothetical protein n=1 Tax=Antrihabitans cavernicola TaxID=2495913 RepID=UPI0035303EBC